MRPLILACLAACLPLAYAPLQAASTETVSPSEFRTYAEGHTLYFARDGKAFGSETFKHGGFTIWRYEDGSCMPGVWQPYQGQLCFYYGDGANVQCWSAKRDAQGLVVTLQGDSADAGMQLRVTRRDEKALVCSKPGPKA